MPRVITLPTFHEGQQRAYLSPGRFRALRCGRRWGKTKLEVAIACDAAAKGENVGFFAPDYKILTETYEEIKDILEPITKSTNKTDGIIRTISKGRVDFWTLENERAGRSRRYHKALIDEGAFTKPNMMRMWETAIRPTLTDFQGSCLVASTPNGVNKENFFWRICNEPKWGFKEFHAPTASNPYMPPEELEILRLENAPLVFQQEFLAEFIDWSGVQFFALDHLLVNKLPVEPTLPCDGIFAVIDTALKDRSEHDGTAVSFWAINKRVGPKLVCLDWDIIHIQGSLLDGWLEWVFVRLKELSEQYRARFGVLGVHIEDKNSGTILLQQAMRKEKQVYPIDSKLTSLGKSARAINVSGYVYREFVKISPYAYNKTTKFKDQIKNHFIDQVVGFKIGTKEDQKDDLLDTFCYAISVSLGNPEGY